MASSHDSAKEVDQSGARAEHDSPAAELIRRLQKQVNEQEKTINLLKREGRAGLMVFQFQRFQISKFIDREKRLLSEHPTLWPYELIHKQLTYEGYEKFKQSNQRSRNEMTENWRYMTDYAKSIYAPYPRLLVHEEEIPAQC